MLSFFQNLVFSWIRCSYTCDTKSWGDLRLLLVLRVASRYVICLAVKYLLPYCLHIFVVFACLASRVRRHHDPDWLGFWIVTFLLAYFKGSGFPFCRHALMPQNFLSYKHALKPRHLQ